MIRRSSTDCDASSCAWACVSGPHGHAPPREQEVHPHEVFAGADAMAPLGHCSHSPPITSLPWAPASFFKRAPTS
jgi:hypothetical protein